MIPKINELDLKFYDHSVELSFSEELLTLLIEGTNIYIEALKIQEEAAHDLDVVNDIETAGNLFVKLLLCFGLCNDNNGKKVFVSIPEMVIFYEVCYCSSEFIMKDSKVDKQTKNEFFKLSKEVEEIYRMVTSEETAQERNNSKFIIKKIMVDQLHLN